MLCDVSPLSSDNVTIALSRQATAKIHFLFASFYDDRCDYTKQADHKSVHINKRVRQTNQDRQTEREKTLQPIPKIISHDNAGCRQTGT